MNEAQFEALKKLRSKELQSILDSPRTEGVIVVVHDDACKHCAADQGTYPKDVDKVPVLPHEGCSHPDGCQCVYAPFIKEVGP